MIHENPTKQKAMLRIKLLRLSAAMSQWHIAQAAQMSQGQYSMVERGLIEPTEEQRERLAQILHASPKSLFRPAYRHRTANMVTPSES